MITLNLDGSEDHSWFKTMFGENYREVFMGKRTRCAPAALILLTVLNADNGAGSAADLVEAVKTELTSSLAQKSGGGETSDEE